MNLHSPFTAAALLAFSLCVPALRADGTRGVQQERTSRGRCSAWLGRVDGAVLMLVLYER